MQTTSTTVASTIHELRDINCLSNTRTTYSEDSFSAGASGLQIGGSGMNLGQVGEKRVLAPRVTGNDVTSKQSERLFPRSAVVSLDDVDVVQHSERPCADQVQENKKSTGFGFMLPFDVPFVNVFQSRPENHNSLDPVSVSWFLASPRPQSPPPRSSRRGLEFKDNAHTSVSGVTPTPPIIINDTCV